jgi:hypothetical protein
LVSCGEPRQPWRSFLFSETGDLIIARLTPEKYEEISRTHLIDATNPETKNTHPQPDPGPLETAGEFMPL